MEQNQQKRTNEVVEVSLEKCGIHKLSAGRRLSLFKFIWGPLSKKDFNQKTWKAIDIGTYILFGIIEAITFSWVISMFYSDYKRKINNSYSIHTLAVLPLIFIKPSVLSLTFWVFIALIMYHYSYRHSENKEHERLAMADELAYIEPPKSKNKISAI